MIRNNTTGHDVDLGEIAAGLTQADIPVMLDNSGGGVMCLYLGDTFTDAAGDRRYPLIFGPGWLEYVGNDANHNPVYRSIASTDELSYVPDDDGDSESVYITPGANQQQIVDQLAAAYRKLPTRPIRVTIIERADSTIDVHATNCPDVTTSFYPGEVFQRRDIVNVTSQADVLVVVWETEAGENEWNDLSIGRADTRFHTCLNHLPHGDDHDVYWKGNHGAHTADDADWDYQTAPETVPPVAVRSWFRLANPTRSAVGPCPCECNSGGFCGGCGHAGCGRR